MERIIAWGESKAFLSLLIVQYMALHGIALCLVALHCVSLHRITVSLHLYLNDSHI